MSFLRRIVAFAAAPSASAAAARRPLAGSALTLGQFVHPHRRAGLANLPERQAGFAPLTDRELNIRVWPEAGADSAPGEHSVPDAHPADAGHRMVDLRQPVSDPWEVAGNGERRDVPSKHRSWQKLEVSRLLGERIQSGKSVESAQRPVFDTSAKAMSEWTKVHANPPSRRPAKPSPAPSSATPPSALIPAAPTDVSSPDPGPAPPQGLGDAAFSGANEPGTQAEAIRPGGFADQTANGFQGTISPYAFVPSSPTMPSKTAEAVSIAGDTASTPSVSGIAAETVSPRGIVPGGRENLGRPAASVAPVYTAESPSLVESASSGASHERTAAWHDAHAGNGALEPVPAVHIGTVEIFIEAAAAPRNASHPASRQGDFASRHYLRGL